MKISEILKRALSEVQEAELPNNLVETAYAKAVDLVARETKTEPNSDAGDPLSEASQTGLGAIASRLKVSDATVAEVFYEENGSLGIGLGPSRLDRSASGGTKQIAILISAGRQAGGYDDGWTSVDVIREVCRDFNRLSTGNFANTISEMADVFAFRGRGQQREVRLTRPGWEQAGALVVELAGGETFNKKEDNR